MAFDNSIKKEDIFPIMQYDNFYNIINSFKYINNIYLVDDFITLREKIQNFEYETGQVFMNEWNIFYARLKYCFPCYYTPIVSTQYKRKINENIIDMLTFRDIYGSWLNTFEGMPYYVFMNEFYKYAANNIANNIICKELYDLNYPKNFIIKIIKIYSSTTNINTNFIHTFSKWFLSKCKQQHLFI